MKKSTLLLAGIVLSSLSSLAVAQNQEIPKEASLKVNEVVAVDLPANPTTGYLWIIRQLPSEVALVDMEYRQSPECKKGMVGCGGKTVLHLKGVTKGSGELVLQYVMPMQPLPSETQSIKVTVAE
ncbi:protease inhibitor I42 family protein [Plesiomonas shigelloides]|uniref:protease inhibitor I42 family protein n=1 Tax=Plesiomonas shigelloides TaxID=703 RepID=UPI0012624F01|nr:protease inhibitor I42 family protein [Plesiomonas shigelloides]KAB7701483.1 hypothetical protein GBN26_05875 [Plesiomonas shigelloides]